MTELEVAWLAGIIEGEGHFGCQAGGSPRISIAMVDRDVIERVARLLQGKIHAKPNRAGKQQQWATGVYGRRAPRVMKLLYPFMGRRRQTKINKIISEYAERSSTRYTRAAASMRKYWADPENRAKRLLVR